MLWGACSNDGPIASRIDAVLELGAYEALWAESKTSFKSLAERFSEVSPGTRPSDLVPEDEARDFGAKDMP